MIENPDKIYYSIGEVSRMLDISISNLRYWEKEFRQLKPKQSERKTRFYTKDDINLLKKILFLTREKAYTLEGARRQLTNRKSEVEIEQELFERLSAVKVQLNQLIKELKEK